MVKVGDIVKIKRCMYEDNPYIDTFQTVKHVNDDNSIRIETADGKFELYEKSEYSTSEPKSELKSSTYNLNEGLNNLINETEIQVATLQKQLKLLRAIRNGDV